jgi:hypothetical protein
MLQFLYKSSKLEFSLFIYTWLALYNHDFLYMEIVTNMGAFLQVKAWLEDGKDVRLGDWKAADIEILNTFQLLTAKPVVYLVSCLFMMIIIFFNCLICSLMVEWV